MTMKALVKDTVTTLYRVNPKTGYLESVEFVGSLKLKAKGWSAKKPEWRNGKWRKA